MAIAFLLQLLLFLLSASSLVDANNQRKTYLVQMKVGGHRYGSSSGHQELLGEVLDDDSTVANALIYTYKESFTGFSASLTQNERQKLKRRREVLEVSRSRNLKLLTTRSWDLMNLTLSAPRYVTGESDLVVAVIDTGIWPNNSHIFGDQSDGPPPQAWKNKCQNITCNNKIVGARSYYREEKKFKLNEEKSVIDVAGQGTHVASIVAGKEIKGASYYELAKGTLRGGVPNAKIAVYKTCWEVVNKKRENVSVCPDYGILKAIDDAIDDNVNVITFSQGLEKPDPLRKDQISWAFLRAFEKGILTSVAAGNSGSDYFTVTNGAPWIMTVAASLKDRFYETKLELQGEDKPITVYSTINTVDTQDSFYPLLDETESPVSTRRRELIAEIKDDLIMSSYHKNYLGKDVFMNESQIEDKFNKINEEAKGAIVWGNYSDNKRMGKKVQLPIPSIYLDKHEGVTLEKYYNKYKSKSSVKIHKTVEIHAEEGWKPIVADESSRGPNTETLLANILKPDIAAPGLDILAGWIQSDDEDPEYNIMSGTSMACPHAAALALYLKSFYPNWSPSAIKSAVIISTEMEAKGNEFAYGSGFLNATNVLEPGLVYETKYQDYIDYMCKQGYNTERLRSNLGNAKIDCSKTKKDDKADLNYPTMTARVDDTNTEFTTIFKRAVTNVGDPKSTYDVETKLGGEKDFDVKITVEPKHLEFIELGETKSFTVTVTGELKPSHSEKSLKMSNAWLMWKERHGSRQVRSPIVIYSSKNN